MFFHLKWNGGTSVQRRVVRLRTTLGAGRAWICAECGRGELALEFRLSCTNEFVDPESSTALGHLAALSGQLPRLEGSAGTLTATPFPQSWIEAADSILPFFGRLGLDARIDGRALVLSAEGSPNELMDKAGAAFLSLDRFTKPRIDRDVLEQRRHFAVSAFENYADEVLRLLDEQEGPRALNKLLGKGSRRTVDHGLETEILNVLRRTKTEVLVHFESGGGHLAVRVAIRRPLLKVITVDSSPARRDRAHFRLGFIGEARLGSLAEIYAPLPTDSTVLVVDSMPPVGDIRLEDAEQTLFAARTFNWILCIAGADESRENWSTSISERFGYRQTSWRVSGSRAIFLFRRKGDAGAPAPASSESRRVIDTRILGPVKVEVGQWTASLETFSKWTVDPRWLIYLPPGM